MSARDPGDRRSLAPGLSRQTVLRARTSGAGSHRTSCLAAAIADDVDAQRHDDKVLRERAEAAARRRASSKRTRWPANTMMTFERAAGNTSTNRRGRVHRLEAGSGELWQWAHGGQVRRHLEAAPGRNSDGCSSAPALRNEVAAVRPVLMARGSTDELCFALRRTRGPAPSDVAGATQPVPCEAGPSDSPVRRVAWTR